MKINFVIFILFLFYSITESFAFSRNSSDLATKSEASLNSTKCDDPVDFPNIPCMTHSEHEDIWNGVLKYGSAKFFNTDFLFPSSTRRIGSEELRKVLNMSLQLKVHNGTRPWDIEFESAPTLATYFDLKEQNVNIFDLGTILFNENNYPPAIKFLDERIPEIRAYFRCRFEKLHPIGEVVDKLEIDTMIDEYEKILKIVRKAIRKSKLDEFCEDHKEKALRKGVP